MTQAIPRSKVIRERELPCALFEKHLQALQLRICDAFDGYPPSIETVLGQSRVGKTMFMNSLAHEYSEVLLAGVRHVPVLVVPTPALLSPCDRKTGALL